MTGASEFAFIPAYVHNRSNGVNMRRLLMVLGVTLSFMLSREASSQETGELEIEEFSFLASDGKEIRYEVGTLYVQENRDEDDSRAIGLGFARFLADEQPATSPPIFILPGGPGSSLLDLLELGNKQQRERFFNVFGRYRSFADVVLVDQRGFSRRGDVIEVNVPESPTSLNHVQTPEEDISEFMAFAKIIVAQYEESDIDLRGYTVMECAHDVDDLRTALEYETITLQGTSFGSQWCFAIMRLYPEIVTRALLSGVEPLDHAYDMPSHVYAACQRMWFTIDEDPRFKAYLPEGGIAEAMRSVQERLEAEPMRVERVNARTGEKTLVGVIGPEELPWSDPTAILELYHRKTERVSGNRRGGNRSMALIGPLIDTSLGVTPERGHRLMTDAATRFLGRSGFATYMASADIWPSPDVGDDFRRAVICDIPVIFAQGDWDTSTPIENTLEIAPYFINSRVIIAEQGGHGVIDPIAEQLPGTWNEIVEFLRNGDMEDLPVRVRLRPSREFTPPNFSISESPR